jgi:hypothetical protein
LEATGHEIKRGKHISIRAPGQERFTRTKTLGVDYTEDAITKRIAGEYTLAAPPAEHGENVIDFTAAAPDMQGVDSGDVDIDIFAADTKQDSHTYTRPAPAVNLIKDIENCVKAQQSAGFERWQKIQNLKEAAKTLNFLTENKLLQYADLESKTLEVAAAFDNTADTLKAAEKRLADMAALLKNISTYQQTKPVVDDMRTAKDPAAYRREHQSAFILHEAAAKALKAHATEGGKLPNPVALQGEYNRLTEKKNALRVQYGKLQQQAREMGIVKRNVDSILNPGTERAKGRDRNAEL